MEKGNLGIRLGFYGVVAFILAYFGSTTLLFLLAGFVLISEKNDCAVRQVIQALCLWFARAVIVNVMALFNVIGRIPIIGTIWYTFTDVIEMLLDIAVLVFVIIAIIKNAKGKEANIPLANKFADWACGIVRPKAVAPAPQQAAQGFCRSCGAPLTGGAFCNTCGKPVAPAPQQAAAPQQPQQ